MYTATVSGPVARDKRDSVRFLVESQILCDEIPNANKVPLTATGTGNGVSLELTSFILDGRRKNFIAPR